MNILGPTFFAAELQVETPWEDDTCRQLWAQVIERAVLDLATGTAKDRQDAYIWLFNADDDATRQIGGFEWACGELGLDCEKMRHEIATHRRLRRTRYPDRRIATCRWR